MRLFADLHTHSTFSDGASAPAELVLKARRRGVSVLALTDHDTLRGLPEASAAGERLGVCVVAGVELSVRLERRNVHLLGHFFDPEDDGLRAFLRQYETARRDRAAAMVRRLGELGLRIGLEDVAEAAGEGIVGRPHIARALEKRGYVASVEEAFARFLGDEGPAYVALGCPPAREAIDALHAAGGMATLAHPGHWTSDREVRALAHEGLDGLETIHPAHDSTLFAYYRRLAEALGLLETGGSDYHGFRPADERRFGRLGLSRERYERLVARTHAGVPI
jgi:hypothetical protein